MIISLDQQPNERQLTMIRQQLGREPRGIDAVSAEDGQGTPLVLRMHSLVDDAPFPTLYWLCSDRLKIELSHLEAAGVIKHLEAMLADDAAFMAEYHRSHEDYVAKRWHFMSPAVKTLIEQRGYTALMNTRGVGGITNWNQVRCLHTQYAHHLCGDNAIGRWIDAHYPAIAASLP